MIKFKISYFIFTIILFLVEVYIAVYVHDDIIRPYFGDFLVVILIYCFIMSFFNFHVVPTSLFVLMFSYLIETLQYFKIVELLHLQKFAIARVVIGTSFEWTDILSYTAGIIFVLIAEFFWRSGLPKTL